jgi:FMN-dependent oxidoreductase (nitrilotriacetate monooxygenase family)
MPSKPRQLHINVNVQGAGAHPAAWRSAEGRRFAVIDVTHFQEVARISERGLLDAVFLADMLALPVDPRLAPMWSLDPIIVTTAMLLATERIGFIVTSSTTFQQPYTLARQILSLDHASKGRVGWNVVTTYEDRAARNHGLKELPPHDNRYAVAADFTEAVLKLWDSWEDEALVANVKSGAWGDPERIHAVEHAGPYFSVEGALQVPRSPQGRPLLVQAGSSPQGREFAASRAEAVFTVQQSPGEARAYYADVKARAARYGRRPDQIAILPGISLVIGGTEAEAIARKEALDEIAGAALTLQRFAGRLGIDAAELELDQPFPERLLGAVKSGRGSQGFADANLVLLSDRSLTMRQILARGGGGHFRVVGSPEQIADVMETWFNERAADGFNIMSDVYPSGLEAFVDHVVPVLQKRGIFRREYEGATLREHYGAPRPQNLFTAAPERSRQSS